MRFTLAKHRLLSVLLAGAMLFSMTTAAFAEGEAGTEGEDQTQDTTAIGFSTGIQASTSTTNGLLAFLDANNILNFMYTIDNEITLTAADLGGRDFIHVDQGKTLVVEDGGHLILDGISMPMGNVGLNTYSNGTLRVRDGGKVTIKNKGSLSVSRGGIFVEDGGEIHILGAYMSGPTNSFVGSLENAGKIRIEATTVQTNVHTATFSVYGAFDNTPTGVIEIDASSTFSVRISREDHARNRGTINVLDGGWFSITGELGGYNSDPSDEYYYFNEGQINIAPYAGAYMSGGMNTRNAVIFNEPSGSIVVSGGGPGYALDVYNSEFYNRGSIELYNTGGYGLRVDGRTYDGPGTHFVNESGGVIDVNNSGDSYGIYVSANNGSTLDNVFFINEGDILVNNDASNPECVGFLFSGDTVTNNGRVVNSGSMGVFHLYESLVSTWNGTPYENQGGKFVYETNIIPSELVSDDYGYRRINDATIRIAGMEKVTYDEKWGEDFFLESGPIPIQVTAAGYHTYNGTITIPSTLAEYDKNYYFRIEMTPDGTVPPPETPGGDGGTIDPPDEVEGGGGTVIGGGGGGSSGGSSSGGSSRGGSSGGSSRADGSTTTTTAATIPSTTTTAPGRSGNVNADGSVNATTIRADLDSAIASAAGSTATVRTRNASSISAAALKSLASAASSANKTAVIHADTLSADGKAVQGRLYVEPAKLTGLAADLKLGVYTQDSKVSATKNHFQKYFSNKLAVVTFDQQGALGARLQVAAKVDLSGMNTANLVFYTYDKASNQYNRIANPNCFIDASGYLHFYTEQGGAIIISEGALAK